MPKGRVFAPSTARDGIWFMHRGIPDTWPVRREDSTDTGLMLSAPYRSEMTHYPPQPPSKYENKHTARNFKLSNNFSAHDNRHSFQDHGVYFGNGTNTRTLGKRNKTPDHRQHYTSKDYLKHDGRSVVDYDYNPIYKTDYRGRVTSEPPTRRRFPRNHKEGEPGLTTLTSTTTSWHKAPDVPFKTPLHVLAVSQEPFLPSNKWKYSYHGLPKCYPPYDKVNNKEPFSVWLIPGINSEKNKITS